LNFFENHFEKTIKGSYRNNEFDKFRAFVGTIPQHFMLDKIDFWFKYEARIEQQSHYLKKEIESLCFS
jgi:hypothetical protein